MASFLTPEVLQQLLPYKKRSLEIARLFHNAGLTKQAQRVESCIDTSYCTESGFLAHANFCKNKFCPVCSYKRSREFQARSFPIFEKLALEGYKFVHISLTAPNVEGSEVRDMLVKMGQTWTELCRKPAGKYHFLGLGDKILGSFRSFEVTYNAERHDYHPHLHALVVVPSDYGPQGTWLDASVVSRNWTYGLTGSYTYVSDGGKELSYNCKLRFVRLKKSEILDKSKETNLGAAVCEVAKYPLKPVDFDAIDDFAEKVEFLKTLWEQTYHLRMYSFSGILKRMDIEMRESDSAEQDFRFIQLLLSDDAPLSPADLIIHRVRFKDGVFLPDCYFGFGKYARCAFDSKESLRSFVFELNRSGGWEHSYAPPGSKFI